LMISDAEARRVARELREEIDREGWESAYSRYCLACKERVPLDGWTSHIISGRHQENELARQEAQLKENPLAWQRENWPTRHDPRESWPTIRPLGEKPYKEGPDDTRWCPTCERPIAFQNWYAHLESHRTKIKKPVF